MRTRLSLVALLFLPLVASAQANAIVPDADPELERKSFIIAPGFEVNLFAADPMLAKPLQINFDPQGRLWVASSEVYPQIKPGEKANDKVLILEDTNADGIADKTTVFADGLLIPTGIEPGDGGAYVANSTELVHLSASKPGGKADRTKVMLSGFGTEDTHHIIHTFRWGPDQALYFNQSIYIHSHIETPHGVKRLNAGGIWRYKPQSNELDVLVRGFVNTWGHHFNLYGQSLITDGAGGEGINHGVPGAYYLTAANATRILHGMNPGSPKYCGLEVVSGRHLPDDWQGNLITNDFRGHRVCRFVLRDAGSSFESREMPELIKTNHAAFRPIDVKMGPDGAIYIADWYNPIIQHGEVDFRDPRRDKTHGRIWRVTAKGRPLVQRPKLVEASVAELIEHLKSPEDWTRQNAKRVLKERGAEAVFPELTKATPSDERHRLELAWVKQSLNAITMDDVMPLVNATDAGVRAAAARIIADPTLTLCTPGEWTKLLKDENPRVRMEAVRAIIGLKSADAATLALGLLELPMDPTLDYALWLTIRDLESYWLPEFQAGRFSFGNDLKKLAFALQASGSSEAVKTLIPIATNTATPAEQRRNLWLLLAKFGGPSELGRVIKDGRLPEPAEYWPSVLATVEDSIRSRKVNARYTTEWESLTLDIADPRAEVKQPALRLAGLIKAESMREVLQRHAIDAKNDYATQRAAFEGLLALDVGKAKDFAVKPIATPSAQAAAIATLASIDAKLAATQAVKFLGNVTNQAFAEPTFSVFFSRRDGPPALAAGLANQKVPADVAKIGLRVVRNSSQNHPALVNALTTAGGLATASKEPTPDEVKLYVAEVLSKGNAARGEAIYRRKELQCLTCHAISGAGGVVGPDMTSIGASAQPDYLVESILIPNKAVKEGYHAIEVSTTAGKIVSGIKLREANGQLVLRTNDGNEVTIAKDDIDLTKPARSLMPAALADSLTREEFVDLVRFLSELGKVGPYAPNPARLVRRWQTVEPTGPATNIFRRERVSVVADKPTQFNWLPTYSLVSGVLPLGELPKFVVWNGSLPQTVVRFELDATIGGATALKFDSAEGIALFVGNQPVEAKPTTTIEVKPGITTVTLVVDLSKRNGELKCELVDAPNSPARVSVVNGK